MKKDSLQFLKDLLEAHGVSGFEHPVRQIWRNRLADAADEVTVDTLGNCIAVLNPSGRPRVLLAGHADEIGFQVTHIDGNGFLHFTAVGGHDVSLVPGRRVLVHTRHGNLPGVTGKKAIHLMTPEERKKVPEIHELWIDIGAGDREEAASLVEIGDSITYDTGFRKLRNDRITARALDNRTGAFVAAETLLALTRSKKHLKVCVVAVATVQEEVGTRGATTATYGVDPDIGICLDVTHASDSPGMDERKIGEVKLGGGPRLARGACIHPEIFEKLKRVAERKGIPYQVGAIPGAAPNDARAIQLARDGVATAIVGIPLRYMHTPSEVVSLTDLEHSIELLREFSLSLTPKTSWTLQ